MDRTTYQQISVNETLYKQMQASFVAGQAEVWRISRSLITDLIKDVA